MILDKVQEATSLRWCKPIYQSLCDSVCEGVCVCVCVCERESVNSGSCTHSHATKEKNGKCKGNGKERKERKVMSKQNSIHQRKEEDEIISRCDVCVWESERVSEWVSEWMSECVSEWVSECVCACLQRTRLSRDATQTFTCCWHALLAADMLLSRLSRDATQTVTMQTFWFKKGNKMRM